MPKGYVLFTESVRDEEGMAAYGQQAVATMLKAGGRPIVVEVNAEVVEGDWPGPRTVILEFDSVEAERGWYHSSEYQAVIPLRQAAADANVAIVAGFEMPGG